MNLEWNQIADVLGDEAGKLQCHVVTDVISSTNDWSVWSCGFDQLPAVCLAEQQVTGRGRNGRAWVSPPCENIYFSLVWPFNFHDGKNLNGLSLVAGIVIARVISGYGVDAKVKWPNDVLVNGAKIAGILIETKIKPNGKTIAIIGAGINYALSEKTRLGIGQPVSDFVSSCHACPFPDRNQLAGMLIKSMIQACEEFERNGFKVFADEWRKYDACFEQDVDVHDVSGVWSGKVTGLNDQCALRVMRNNDECIVYAADVSIRIK